MKSPSRATPSRPASSSSPRWPAPAARGTTSSPPSMTARGCGCFRSMTGSTRRPRSSSPTSCWTSSRSASKRSKLTFNGSEFQSAFHWHLADRGIRHIYIKPATPRLNGKVERSHRIDGEEFYRMLKGVVIDDTELFDDKLAEWQTSTTTIGPTAPSAAKLPTNASARRPPRQRPPSNRSTSDAHRAQSPNELN
jgi:transposase InsO family protein